METLYINGKTETMFYPERDFPALVREHMGDDAARYTEKLIENQIKEDENDE